MVNIRKRLLIVLSIFLYRILLDLAFCKWISPFFSYYMQLKYIVNIDKVVISYLLLVILVVFSRFNKEKITDVVMSIQLFTFIIPMLTLYAFSDRSSIFIFSVTLVYILQELIISLVRKMHNRIPEIVICNAERILILGLFSLLFLAVCYTFIKYGLVGGEAFDFENIYEIRANISYAFPFSYIVPWGFKIVCLFLVVWSLNHKKYFVALLCISLQIYFFLVYANKTTLFTLILVLSCYFIVNEKLDIIKSIIIGLSGIIIVSILYYIVCGKITLLSYLVRRPLLVPATIKFAYYDFFSNPDNSYIRFADNSIGHLLGIDSSYKLEAPKIIAEYLNVPDSYCNTGYFGDAYANFGMIGLFIFSIIFIVLIIYMEYISKDLSKTVVYPIVISMVYNLNDQALFTWLLGGGGGLLILIMWMYKNSSRGKELKAKL